MGADTDFKTLYDHFSTYCELTVEEWELAKSYFEFSSLDKKEVIYSAGSTVLKHYFVTSGCLHMYLVNDKGDDQTLQFAINNWWITDYLAFQQRRSSEFYIQAVEPSRVLSITPEKQDELLARIPKLEVYFRNIYQTAYGAAINRMKYIFTYSKEEIYYSFRDAFPDFVNSVPQYLVATYLGLSPEYVSKLKKKSLS